jgi:hypothetical protein
MNFSSPAPGHQRRLAGLAAALALHLALWYGWRLSHQHMKVDAADAERIEWVTIKPPRPVKSIAVAAKPVVRTPSPRQRHAPAPAPHVQAPAEEPRVVASPAADAPPQRSAADMMAQARKDLGKIDKELQKEFPGPRIKAPPDSPQIRLEKGIELANELAPPKWYEPAKIKEIIDPGGTGKKRYRVITSSGTTCWTYDSNRSPDAIDKLMNGSRPKVTNCPEHEQPATTQKW